MDFKVKSAESLRDSMINWVRSSTNKIKNFRIGSMVVSIIESVALTIESLYYDILQGLRSAVEVAVYSSFDFSKQEATKATGMVRFYRNTPATQNYVIPAGTLVSTEADIYNTEVVFETTEVGVILTGLTSVTVTVRAVNPGISGNVIEDKVTVLVSNPSGIEGVSNPDPMSGGKDAETLSEMRNRFVKYIDSKYRATGKAIEYAAITEGGASEAQAIDSPDVSVMLENGSVVVDRTTELSNPFIDDVPLFVSPVTTDQRFYISASVKYSFFYIEVSRAAVGGSVSWQYYNGNWEDLTIIEDGIIGLTRSGAIRFEVSDDWKPCLINGVWGFWIRCCVLDAGFSTVPKANFIFVNPPPGFVDLYVINSNGGYSPQLLSDVKDVVEDYRGAGITVNVFGGVKKFVDVNLIIMINIGFSVEDIINELSTSIQNYLDSRKLGETLLYDQLYQFIRNFRNGVVIKRIVSLTPDDDVALDQGRIIKAGAITVEVV